MDVSHWLSPERSLNFLKDFLELSREQGANLKTLDIVREAIIRESTYNFGHGRSFTDQEIILLAKQLLECRNPYTCPKGRLTFFEIPTRDFEKRFPEKDLNFTRIQKNAFPSPNFPRRISR